MAPNFLPFQRQLFLCLVLSSFIWMMDRASLSCLVVWVEGPFPICCLRFLTSVSLNSQCDTFQPQEARLEWIWEAVCIMNWNWGTAAAERLVECCCVVEQEKIYGRVKYVWTEGVQCTRDLCAVGITLCKSPCVIVNSVLFRICLQKKRCRNCW